MAINMDGLPKRVRNDIRQHLGVGCDDPTFNTLLECYPTAMIELTSYERPLGVDHKRMIVWEVRDH